MTIFKKRDNRFSTAADQAAKALGVTVKYNPAIKAAAVFDAQQWKAEMYHTNDGRFVAVSSDKYSVSAALLDNDDGISAPCWAEYADMKTLCSEAGIYNKIELMEARAREAERQRELAA